MIAEVNEARVEGLFDEVERTPSQGALAAAPEEADDEPEYQVLSNLFGAADRLVGDPEDQRRRRDLLAAASSVGDWPAPFGLTDDQWWQIRARTRAVSESIEADADPDAVEENTVALRNLLRRFV